MNSIGFLDYLLLTAALALSWRMYHATPPPAAGGEPPAPATAPPPGAAMAPPPSAVPGQTALERILGLIFRDTAAGTVASFLDGARLSYELAVKAFAQGELEEQSRFLSAEVGEAFAEAVAERRRRGETTTLTFIGFRSADIVGAGVEDGTAWIDVRFLAEIVSVTRSEDGRIVAGDPKRVVETAELWTFERDLAATTPGWIIVATDADS